MKAVIFDMDGVLLDTEKYLVRCWVQAGREAGFPMETTHALQLRSLSGQFAQPLLTEIFGPSFDYTAVRARRKELMAAHIAAHGLEKKPFADETLDTLRNMHYQLAVATATDHVRTENYLRQVGLYEKFDRIICAEMVAHGKPCPDIYLYACRQLRLPPEECAAVEDSPNGVRAAASAGLHTIMIPDLTQPDAELEKLLYAKADSLQRLPALLDAPHP